MIKISMLSVFAVLIFSSFVHASQLVPATAESLTSSAYVVIGKVTSVSYDQARFAGSMEIAILGSLKGEIGYQTLRIPVDRNPLSGFDVLLNKDEIAIFFVRELKDGKAYLVAPGAIATFPKNYFK